MPRPDTAAVIVNMHSGSTRRALLHRLPELFRNNGIRAEMVIAPSGSHVRRFAQAAARRHPLVVAAGGDGTISAVAAQVIASDSILGVLPLGTYNHFARDLNIPLVVEDAVRVLAEGTPRRVDVGEVNGHTFINNSSLGLYPRLVEEREQHRRLGYRRWVALTAALLSTFRRFGFVHVRVTAGELEYEGDTPFVFVGNNLYTLSGLRLGSRETLAGGHLCVCLARRVSRWQLLRMALRAWLGSMPKGPELDLLCTDEVRVEPRSRRTRVSLDGEIVRITGPLHYRVLPGALQVVAP
ncbi:MAG TPA: diacylglycerol kinase family protein [Beijerinckiaceae bacterium]|nr:diacylglycerol kinase family protein [Beijerinckiaceae bacterium]